MAKVLLTSLGSRYGSVDALNANFDSIESGFDNTLSRDGTGPNAMEAPLDMNGNAILNVSSLNASSLILAGQQVTVGSASFGLAGFTNNSPITATAGQTSFTVAPIAATSLILVFVNGLKLPSSSVSFSGTTVTLPAMQAGDEVEVVELKRA